MKKKKRRMIIAIVAAVAALIVVGVLIMLNIGKAKWEKQELLKYQTSCGGGMNGGSSRTVLTKYGDGALLTFTESEWYYQDSEVKEYLVPAEALEDIRQVFLKHRMYGWDGKTFSNLFIADGETTSYGFSFDEDDVYFSSQYYPSKYAAKLKQLDEVILSYREPGTELPGLVLPELSEEETYSLAQPKEGEITLYVYEYSENTMHYRILNGTDKELSTTGNYLLVNEAGNGIADNSERKLYPGTVYPQSMEEESFKLENRLEPGSYTLIVDEMRCTFEIR